MSETKVCNVCEIDKPITEFYFRKERGAYRNNCKKCKPLVGKAEIAIRMLSTTKVCKHCGEEKHISEYQKTGKGKWLQPYCKPCDSNRKRNYDLGNLSKVAERRQSYYLSTRVLVTPEQKIESRIKCNEAIKKASREYNDKRRMSPEEKKIRRAENAKRFRERHKEKILQKRREYNKVTGLQKKKEWQARMMSNVHFRLTKNLRGRIYVALKKGIKSDTTMNLLGCSIEQFKIHIEDQFTDGMTWGNMGVWHLDHKKPCAKFDLTKESDQRLCFHFTNIQPLWSVDNLRKGTFYQEHKIAV